MQGLGVVIIAVAYDAAVRHCGLGETAVRRPRAGRRALTSRAQASPSTARRGRFSAPSASPRSAASNSWPDISPASVFIFGFPLLGRIIRLAKSEKITSIADFLGARYGKSFAVASIATLIATVGAVPYIALQLKAIAGSVSLMVEHYSGAPPSFDPFVSDISLIIASAALFAVLFAAPRRRHRLRTGWFWRSRSNRGQLAAFLPSAPVVFFLFEHPAGLIDRFRHVTSGRRSPTPSLGTLLVLTSLGSPSSCCRASSTS